MGSKFKFNVGQRVMILDNKQPKFYKQIGTIDFMEHLDKNYYSVVCDDDSLNNTYIYRGLQRRNSDKFWREDVIRLANINKRI